MKIKKRLPGAVFFFTADQFQNTATTSPSGYVF